MASDVIMPRPPVIALMGPTASGKTDLALALADTLNGEIISVDSALVYRGMDIGTAKPDAAQRERVPHHLIDICDPARPYTAADFVRDAADSIDAVRARGRLPILAGGTMLYFRALLEGLSPMPASDAAIRAAIEQEAAERGWPAMHQALQQVDPDTAARLHPNHSQRISRALEVYRATGVALSTWQATAGTGLLSQYDWLQVALTPRRREILHQRIERRFEAMLKEGLIEEVEVLYRRGDLHPGLPAMRAVGYRQVWQYLDGLLEYNAMKAAGIAATRQLAKRQLTWLRGWKDLHWLYTTTEAGETLHVEEILKEVLNFKGIRTI